MKKAVVIGAGFGGIAASIRLVKKGYKVELIDRCNNIGGRAQFFNFKGFKYDAGPTIITAPFLFKELFSIHNKKIEDYITLKPLNTWYRFVYSDGSYFDYTSTYGDLIISNCTYPHEVTKVTSGKRKSLVFFISKHFGSNKRQK